MRAVMSPSLRLALASLLVVAACGADAPAPLTPTKVAPPRATNADAKPDAGAATTAYAGHGASSVPPEVIARFAPPALPSDVTAPIQAMLDVRAPSGGAITQDGKTLFFSWAVTGTRHVWRLDGPQRFPVQMTGGEDMDAIAGLAPDGSYVLVSRDHHGEENPGLYVQDSKGGPLTVIQHKPNVQTAAQLVSDDSRWVYFRSNDIKPASYAIYKWDRTTKTRELVFDQEGIWHAIDIQKDGRLLLSKEVGSNMEEIFEYAPATKTLTPLFGQGERENYEAAYGPKEEEILVLTPRASEYRRIYRWSRAQKSFSAVTPEIAHDVARFSIDRARTRVAYSVNEAGYMRLKVLDAKTLKEIALPKKLASMTADHMNAGATTLNGRFMSVSVETATAPLTSYVVDWKTNDVTQWNLPSAPEVDTTKFAVAKLESYPARDGTLIPMFVRRPATCKDDPCPVIVYFHGGPEGQATAGFNATAQVFVDAGFVFMQPNVRGSDGYGRKWLHADDGARRLEVITDIEDASKFVRSNWASRGRAPKVGILGWSYGGYSTLIGMTMFAGAFDAGAASVGMSNLVTFLENTAPYRRALRTSEYGDPDKDREALKKLSPITYVERVAAPMLILQGASDPRVPVGEAIQLHTALDAKKIPNQLVIFADEGHGTQKRDNRVLELGHMLRFFKEHLAASK
ncbi:MAG: hypothetical protein JWM74_2801 [Myxococcaceae bacterium]|nr:hypothetical protein [Myxococcaceae bacterium]